MKNLNKIRVSYAFALDRNLRTTTTLQFDTSSCRPTGVTALLQISKPMHLLTSVWEFGPNGIALPFGSNLIASHIRFDLIVSHRIAYLDLIKYVQIRSDT